MKDSVNLTSKQRTHPWHVPHVEHKKKPTVCPMAGVLLSSRRGATWYRGSNAHFFITHICLAARSRVAREVDTSCIMTISPFEEGLGFVGGISVLHCWTLRTPCAAPEREIVENMLTTAAIGHHSTSMTTGHGIDVADLDGHWSPGQRYAPQVGGQRRGVRRRRRRLSGHGTWRVGAEGP